ncbi:hypothetical protein Tsubulata_026734 [Turnera subulata]|uniref:F-box domain-containing protein n=1 Tax=Turnera subulata TaxID=218843 RepID=A0A9Q0JHZ3_9ROSI|nr:hypothetical protein Tsubulata_026734 [Turnera subulata]
MEEVVNHGLPWPTVEEILALLPVKSISRFRLVSKEWSSFLVSPKFENFRSRLLVPPAGDTKEYNEDVCETDDDYDVEEDGSDQDEEDGSDQDEEDGFNSGIKLYFPLKRAGNPVYLIGSCNGLVCVRLHYFWNYGHLVVWNPCTGIYRELPNPKYRSEDDEDGYGSYGFGYDSASQDFKILLSGRCAYSSRYSKLKTQILSLKANSWKEIPFHQEVYWDEQEGLFLNGAFHWYSGYS